jgi:Flp pilus assembly protein TadD
MAPVVLIVAGWLAAVSGQQRNDQESQSTVDAIHKLAHAGRFDEMAAKVNTVAPDDPAWKDLLEVLLEAAAKQNDYAYVERKARLILTRGRDADTRAAAAFSLGISYWRSGQLDEAEKAFSEAGQITPGSELANNARGNIHEMRYLRVAQPAPSFAVRTTNGSKLDINDLRGKTVLLNFWASW